MFPCGRLTLVALPPSITDQHILLHNIINLLHMEILTQGYIPTAKISYEIEYLDYSRSLE